MRVLVAVFVLSPVTVHAAEHKSIWLPFTPERNTYARRLVTEHFQIVRSLDQIDPGVLKAFYKVAPRRDIAVGSQPFAETDISDGRPKRFDFAGHTADLWFVVYEVGGRATTIPLSSLSAATRVGVVSRQRRVFRSTVTSKA